MQQSALINLILARIRLRILNSALLILNFRFPFWKWSEKSSSSDTDHQTDATVDDESVLPTVRIQKRLDDYSKNESSNLQEQMTELRHTLNYLEF